MNKSKILSVLGLIFIITAVYIGFIQEGKNNINIPIINEDILHTNPEYTEIFVQRIDSRGRFIISFVIKEEGNKNVFGDIVYTDAVTKENDVVSTFNTSRMDFEKSVFLKGTELSYTEILRFGGDETSSENKKVDLGPFVHPGK